MKAAEGHALYLGRVTHRRPAPIERSFSYRHFLLCLDLDRLDTAFEGRWLWSHERANLVSLRRRDYLGPPEIPLRAAVRERVRGALGREPRGKVFLLAQPRWLGFVFNPVSFYYCFDERGGLDAVVAEITNTPWNERHAYVVDGRGSGGAAARGRFAKAFHVSPFLGMQQEYAWELSALGPTLDVRMRNFEAGRETFEVVLAMRRQPLDGPSLARVLALAPGFSARTLAAIYWQALRLRLAGAPFFEHPKWTAPEQATR